MTDQRFEELLHDILDAETPMRAPERLVPETQRAVRRVRRQPTWLATLRERPMRASRRVVVGSPIQRRLAMGVALLLLALVTVGTLVVGAQLLEPRTIVVDPGGNGDATTVTAGIALAEDGDIVLLRPGVYVEDVVLDKRITLRGDQEDGSATIRWTFMTAGSDKDLATQVERFLSPARLGAPGHVGISQARGVSVRAGGSVLEDLAIVGPSSGLALRVSGDDVTLSRVEIDFEGVDEHHSTPEFQQVMAVLADGGDITIVDSSIEGDVLLEGRGESRSVLLRHNTISGEIGIRDAEAVLEDNTVRAGPMNGSGVTVRGDTDITLEQNDIRTHDRAIFLEGAGVRGTVTNNVVAESAAGLYLQEGAIVTAERNTFADNDMGIRSRSAGTSLLQNNTVEDNGVGIILAAGSTEVRDNRIIGNRNQGIGVLDDASPVVADNELCGNGTDLFVAETANPDSSGNVICPAAE